jgi:hypothetical protein
MAVLQDFVPSAQLVLVFSRFTREAFKTFAETPFPADSAFLTRFLALRCTTEQILLERAPDAVSILGFWVISGWGPGEDMEVPEIKAPPVLAGGGGLVPLE